MTSHDQTLLTWCSCGTKQVGVVNFLLLVFVSFREKEILDGLVKSRRETNRQWDNVNFEMLFDRNTSHCIYKLIYIYMNKSCFHSN